nr:unnamed protein product [Spirometra erinaceieuropaei]
MRQARDRQRESIALSGSNPGKSVANSFRHRSSSKRGHELPPMLNDNKVFLTDDTDKAELFSAFFAKHLATESDPTSTNNRIIRCGNCGVFVHQGCYGILKLPNFGNWFCRKCESQVRMSKIKCEFCPTRNGAFKRCNGNRCGWAHVLCALFIPEIKFADNQSMDLILTESVPSERFNKNAARPDDATAMATVNRH